MSRMLAAKAALACRYDSLGEETTTEMGNENRSKLTSRISMLEEGHSYKISGMEKNISKFAKYEGVREVQQYHDAADTTLASSTKRKFDESYQEEAPKMIQVKEESQDATQSRTRNEKKKKKKKKQVEGVEADTQEQREVKQEAESAEGEAMEVEKSEKKKRKKKKNSEAERKEEDAE